MKVVDLLEFDPNVHTVHELPSESSIRLAEVSKLIFKSKKSTMLTGAGISCNAGIPDFRSSDGLYNLVKAKYPKTVVKGQDLFDISLFRDELTLQIFCTFMESLYKSSLQASPTETHKFIKLMKEKNKLLRCYTQNIDGIERLMNLNTGVKLDDFDVPGNNTQRAYNSNFNKNWKNLDVIQLHGDLHQLSCTQCFHTFDWTSNYQTMLSNGDNPECQNCQHKYNQRLYQGKRLTGNIGILRPGIVLYGENHPQSEILAQGFNTDIKLKPDLLIIMGTSLKVDGIKKLVKNLATMVHSRNGKVIFVNKTPLNNSWTNYVDYQVLSDCDDFVKWLKLEIPDLFLTQEQLDSKKLKNRNQNTPPATPKKNKSKPQVKIEQNQTNQLTSPNPSPIKKSRPILKRKNINIDDNNPKLKYELPSPPSSFNENITIIKQEPMEEMSSKNNKRIKTE